MHKGLLTAWWLAAACSSPTQLIVLIDSDFAVPEELAGVMVSVVDERGKNVGASSFDLAALGLPMSFGIEPTGDLVDERVRIVVTGVGPSGASLVERVAIVGFVDGERHLLAMFLARSCRGMSCPDGQTCSERGCISAEVVVEDLPVVDPGGEIGHDSGVHADAGAPNPDASESDASVVEDSGADDAGEAPDADAGDLDADADAGDAGPGDAGSGDADADTDGGQEADAMPPADSGFADATPPFDSGAPPDAMPPIDSGSLPDAMPPFDSGSPPDAMPPFDSGSPPDAMPPPDGGPPSDGGPSLDGGGAFDSGGGCQPGFMCEDGDLCTSGDLCGLTGNCVPGPPVSCLDDGNVCTVEFCDPAMGCVSGPAMPGAPCEDGDLCTSPDACFGTFCLSGPPVTCFDDMSFAGSCVVELCDPAVGCTSATVPDLDPCQSQPAGFVCCNAQCYDTNTECCGFLGGCCMVSMPPSCEETACGLQGQCLNPTCCN
jgi:hypothetical protein